MRKLEIVRVIATIVLAVVAVIIACLMLFKTDNVQADDIVTMAVLNQYKEEVQLKIDDLNATITELKIENNDLQDAIVKLKKADITLNNNYNDLKSDIKNIQTREKYFYDMTAKQNYIVGVSKYILKNLY